MCALLVLLLGPSGVGKTSIIQLLEERHGWKVVPSLVTRPLRPNEKYKHSLSIDEYSKLIEEDLLHSHVEQFGFMYGTVRKDIELAEQSIEPWVLDFDIRSFRTLFARTDHRAFIIVPETDEQLVSQLSSAGRMSRIPDAIEQLCWIENGFPTNEDQSGRIELVVNRPGELVATALTIAERAGFARS